MITNEDLRKLRKSAGYTQVQLADLTGISRSHIAAIETGAYDPSLKTLSKIARTCGADVFVSNQDPKVRIRQHKRNVVDIARIREAMRHLSRDELVGVIAFMSMLMDVLKEDDKCQE